MLPAESVIFFGDTARTPYGSKSPKTIRQFSIQIADFLVAQGVKMIVVACNTVSANALDVMRARYPEVPVIGCIAPTAREVVKMCSSRDRIGIMATRATVKAGRYETKIKELAPDFQTKQVACPALVPLIEEGIIDNPIMDLTLRYYLDDFILPNRINKLVLGCTHYPLIAGHIKALYPDLTLFSSSHELATAVNMELTAHRMKADTAHPSHTFYASDLSENFMAMIELILKKDAGDMDIQFKNLDI